MFDVPKPKRNNCSHVSLFKIEIIIGNCKPHFAKHRLSAPPYRPLWIWERT